ncbi:MAG: penicillin-binding protein 2 [Acidimicrobiales bacterium]
MVGEGLCRDEQARVRRNNRLSATCVSVVEMSQYGRRGVPRLFGPSLTKRMLDYLGVTWLVALAVKLKPDASRMSDLRMKPRQSVVKRLLSHEGSGPKHERRLRIIGLAVFAAFGILLVRLYYLQVLNAPSFSRIVGSNSVRIAQISPPRGLILGRDGTVLAGDSVSEEVTLSRSDVKSHPGIVGRVASVIGVPVSQISQALSSDLYTTYQPIPVATNVPIADVMYLREHQPEFQGVQVVARTVRTYPLGTTAAHVLGYLGQITPSEYKSLQSKGYSANSQIGQSGVESSYQAYLRGQPGIQRLEVNAHGRVVGKLSARSPKMGNSVVLNMYVPLQQQVAADLANEIAALRKKGKPATGGAAIVMDPNNGHVLAMASYPTYNPSVWTGGISEAQYQAITSPANHVPLLNRAIDGLYTPGSSFKLATATAALQDHLISPTYTYHDTGSFTIPGCHVGKCNFHNAGYQALGNIQLPIAISASDDSFFYNIGYQFWMQRATYGLDPIQNVAGEYGLGQLTGIDLPGENIGRVDSPQVRQYLHTHYPQAFPYGSWYTGDNLEMAFGQGMTVLTPIEMADAYATFANGGTRYAPEVAGAIVSPSGKVVKKIQPKVTGHVSLPSWIRGPMLAGFEGTVTNPLGTAYYAFQGYPYSKFPIAGKTGTASQNPKPPVSWFTGFGPVGNPRYVVCAVINEAGYGANGGAPVVRQIFQYLMNHPVPKMTLPLPSQIAPVVKTPSSVPIVKVPVARTAPATVGTSSGATGHSSPSGKPSSSSPSSSSTSTTSRPVRSTTTSSSTPPTKSSTTTPPTTTTTTTPPTTTTTTGSPPTTTTSNPGAGAASLAKGPSG